ncbi:MAG: hypothetical protein AAGF23_20360, partial [Acidobacteriota bacterium]
MHGTSHPIAAPRSAEARRAASADRRPVRPRRALRTRALHSTLTVALALCAVAPLAAETSGADTAPSPSALQAEFDAVERPTLVATAAAPETLRVGRAEIRPAAGSQLLLFEVSGQPAGYILDGAGALLYRVDDKFSVAPARTNLEETDGIDVKAVGDGLELRTPVKGLAVWGWDIDLGEIAPTPVDGRAMPEWLTELLDEKYSSNPARDFLRTKRHGHPGYRWAVIHAKDEDLVLDVDPQPMSQTESLAWLQDPRSLGDNPFSGKRFNRPIVNQPIGRTWWQGEAIEFVSTETDIDLKQTGKDRVHVGTRTRLQIQQEGLQLVSLFLSDGVFNDNDWMPYELLSLTLDGGEVDYVRRGQEL